jgi:hypothetical protein
MALVRLMTRRLAMVTTLCLACGGESIDLTTLPDPPEGFPVAWAHGDCAPWDGPATSVYLGSTLPSSALTPTYPHLRITVYVSRADLPGRRLQWQGVQPQVGGAQRCFEETRCDRATDITIVFGESDDPRVDLTGYLDVVLDDGTSMTGGFRATMLDFAALCG